MSLSKPASTHLQLAGIGGNSFSMSTSFRAVWNGLTKFGWESLLRNLRGIARDKFFVILMAIGSGSFGFLIAKELVRMRDRRQRQKALQQIEALAEQRLKADEASLAASSPLASAPSSSIDAAKDHPAAATSTAVIAAAAAAKRARQDPWSQLMRLMRICMPNGASRASLLFVAQFFLLVCRSLLSVKAVKSTVYYLTNAISKASWSAWSNWVVSFGFWMGGGIVINSGLHFVETLIALTLRDTLTRHIHEKYLSDNMFYKASLSKGARMDNLDQRITKDVAEFSQKVAFLYGHSFKPVLEFVLSLREASKDVGWNRPLLLFFVSMVVNTGLRSFVPSLGAQVKREAQLEGNFVHAHSRLIGHAEEVAFLQGAKSEQGILDEHVGALIDLRAAHNVAKLRKYGTDNFLKFFGLMLGGVFIHVPYLLRPELAPAERISSFRATEQMMLGCGSAFTEILLLRNNTAELSGYTQRICELLDFLRDESVRNAVGGAASSASSSAVPSTSLLVAGVTISPPEDAARILVKDLTLEVPQGTCVFLSGPNGAGKTSLFRVIAGLWRASAGTIAKPVLADRTRPELMLLPQRPYLCFGSLRDQVTYPLRTRGGDSGVDRRVIEALVAAGLARLCVGAQRAYSAGINQKFDEWEECLSGGERQRIGFARVYFHRPSFALLDEATSAVNPEDEERLYANVIALGVTVFSIAHRRGLRKFHQRELSLAGDGTGAWKFEVIQPE